MGQTLEVEENKARSSVSDVCASPVSLTSGYHLTGKIDGIEISFLLDTGAAVTLLRQGTWLRVSAKNAHDLKPWSAVTLVSAGGTPLTVHGCASVGLELEGETFAAEVLVVSPLTSEAILGLDFLQKQQASIDLNRLRIVKAVPLKFDRK